MGAQDILAQAVADVFNTLGQEAIFTPAAGDPVAMMVDLDLETAFQPGADMTVWESGATIEYALPDIGREANAGETFTIGATVYTVAAVMENDGFAVKVAVK